MIENVILWRSVVGSHIWGMNRPDSDIDYYICYARIHEIFGLAIFMIMAK